MRTASLLLTIVASFVLSAAARAQVATAEEIQSYINEGNYKEALQKISGALAVRGEAGKAVDRARLYMLKAECHIRMKAPTMASEAYAAAVKEAKDDKARNMASAHQLLMQRQRGLAYRPVTGQPKGAAPVTIDIVDPQSRTTAFAALFADEMAAVQPRLAAAKKSTGLAPIFEAFKLIPRLEALEVAGSGADAANPQAAQTQKLITELSEHSRKLIEAAQKEMARRVSAIDKEVNQFVEIAREVPDPTYRGAYGIRTKIERGYKRKGPTDVHLKDLQQVATTCDQIDQAAKMITEGVPSQAKSFDTVITESDRVRKETARILDADYTTIYKEIPGRPKP